MVVAPKSKSAEIRARLGYPIIDIDGHMNWIGVGDSLRDYIRQVGGSDAPERFDREAKRSNSQLQGGSPWWQMSGDERRRQRIRHPAWWPFPTKNTYDRATSALPRLLHERMDELGLDVTILYQGFIQSHHQDDELRRVGCRAFNMWQMDRFRGFTDRIIPSAAIPMHTPQEAIEETEFAVKELGYKVICIAAFVVRPVQKYEREAPPFGEQNFWLDFYGLDSAHDYDPFWAKCVELGVAPTTHSVGMGYGSRRSISTYMYNHIGHFAWAAEGLCKALFFGGVTRRFPTLRFGFMETGVGWGCNLYADLAARWDKRNAKAIANLDPANLDIELMLSLIERYRDEKVVGSLEDLRASFGPQHAPDNPNDFAACRIERPEDIRDLFVPHFYFGCEADDPMNVWAFNGRVNPFGARLRPMLSSDIGHWDVPDMTKVVEEAYELVEKGLISDEEFKEFAFLNPVRLHAGMNPDFFKGTAVEASVERLISETPSALE